VHSGILLAAWNRDAIHNHISTAEYGTVTRRLASIHSNRRKLASLLAIASLLFWSACSLDQPNQERSMGELGRFSYRASDTSMEGIVIGAPHAAAEPAAADYAQSLSRQTGAALVMAYGFGARRLSVARPLTRNASYLPVSDDPLRRGSVYKEFKELVEKTANGKVKLYVGVRVAESEAPAKIEISSAGFTLEELKALKESFIQIREQALAHGSIRKISLAIEPLDEISWRAAAVRHHGVFLIAERGLNLRLPKGLSPMAAKSLYEELLSPWLLGAVRIARETPLDVPRARIRVLDTGKIESIPSRAQRRGLVIAAPHGSFDEYTAEVVRQISYRTGLAAVIATGFTPTECTGWRINVNRPTERSYPGGEIEIGSTRAQKVYAAFKQTVFEAVQQDLNLYIDIHQNGRQKNIEVATVGISKGQARVIRETYRDARDEVLKHTTGVAPVDLMIEPLDAVEIGAWAAKAGGILSVARKSLHVELPMNPTLGSPKARNAYTAILTILLNRITPSFAPRQDETVAKTKSAKVISQSQSDIISNPRRR
jgi:hypothetical protein